MEYKLKIYRKWYQFYKGTTDPDYPAWQQYGSKGVKLHARWHGREGFHRFFEYIQDNLGPQPSPRHVLHRKNTLKDFRPGNIEWATVKELNNTRRDCRYVTYKGRKQSVQQWIEERGLKIHTVWNRICKKGWTPRQALEMT
jgi:hypothetical protein